MRWERGENGSSDLRRSGEILVIFTILYFTAQVRANTEANYQTIHAGVEPRKPLKVAFSALEKQQSEAGGSAGSALAVTAEEEEEEEEEGAEKTDEVFEAEKGVEGGEAWDSQAPAQTSINEVL